MSKYTYNIKIAEIELEVLHKILERDIGPLSHKEEVQREINKIELDLEALRIADKFEQINALSFESIAKMYCTSEECFPKCCWYRKNDTYCEAALIFAKSYDQALLDIRGDKE